jgi:hypothetical protein
MKPSILLAFFSVLLLSGCETVVDLKLKDNPNLLVVNGTVTNAPGPYNVSLRNTMPYTLVQGQADDAQPVTNAIVRIIDDSGNSETLVEWSPGNYNTGNSSFQGQVGRSYRVDIVTKEGKHYESKSETILPVTPIDSLYYEYYPFDEVHYRIFIDFREPAGIKNYYRWKCFVDGRFQIPIHVDNDNFVDGQEIKGLEVGGWDEPVNGMLVEIQMSSLSRNAYNFWDIAGQQFTQVDNQPYDTPPVPLFGNVYNADNPKDQALGYFGASAVSVQKIVLRR